MSAALAVQPEPQTVSDPQLHADVMRGVAVGKITILDLFDCLPWFKTGADWTAWRAFLCALYALPMTKQELAIYQECTNRTKAPTRPATEAWVPTGSRARKSAVASLLAIWNAAFRIDVGDIVAPGEIPTVPILSSDKFKASTIHTYAKAILATPAQGETIPPLAYLLRGDPTAEVIPLRIPAPSRTYDVDIIIRAATIHSVRSKTALSAFLDEVAFFRSDDSANPDTEIIRGITPRMATIPGAILAALSSPYARKGVLWDAYEEHFGKEDDPVLVWNAPTLRMHDSPQIRLEVARAYEADPLSAKAEYGAKFRDDVETFVTLETLKAMTEPGVEERAPVPGVHYRAFVDPSGGGADPFTLAIAHWDGSRAVLDVLREFVRPADDEGPQNEAEEDKRRFWLKGVVRQMVPLLKAYWIKQVTGDHYAGDWPAERFRDGVHDKDCPRTRNDQARCTREDGCWTVNYEVSEPKKTDIYQAILPIFNSGDAVLLDHKRMRTQFTGLDRRSVRGGHESIDHARGAHDDMANVVAGALVLVSERQRKPTVIRVENQEQFEKRRIHEGIKERIRKLERSQRRGGGNDMPSY